MTTEPTPPVATVQSMVMRYREHIRVLEEGPKTVEQFSKSPYFVSNSQPSTLHPAWHWDEHQLRLDQAALAKESLDLDRKLNLLLGACDDAIRGLHAEYGNTGLEANFGGLLEAMDAVRGVTA